MAAVVLLRVGGEAGQLRGLQRPPRPAHGRQVRVGEGGAGEVLGELLQLLEHGVRTPPPEHRAPPPHAQLLGQRACKVIEIFFQLFHNIFYRWGRDVCRRSTACYGRCLAPWRE